MARISTIALADMQKKTLAQKHKSARTPAPETPVLLKIRQTPHRYLPIMKKQ